MLKWLHGEIVSLSIKTIVNLSPFLKFYLLLHSIFSSVISLDLCREYVTNSSDQHSRLGREKMTNNL